MCTGTDGCTVFDNTTACFCNDGYELSMDQTTCIGKRRNISLIGTIIIDQFN